MKNPETRAGLSSAGAGNAKPVTQGQKPKAKMNAAARVAAWRTSKSANDYKGYRPNPRRTPSGGDSWRQRPL